MSQTKSIVIGLRDIYLPVWSGVKEKPDQKDLTYDGLVANTEFGLKVDKTIQLLRYYQKELSKDGDPNGFSYSREATLLRKFTKEVLTRIRARFQTISQANGGKSNIGDFLVEDLVIEYRGTIGQETPKRALSVEGAYITWKWIGPQEQESSPLIINIKSSLDPVVVGYLRNLDIVSTLANTIYKKPRALKSHLERASDDCDRATDGTGIVGIFNRQRKLGSVKEPPRWDWYDFSLKYNAHPYSDTLSPKRKEKSTIEKAPDKFKKRTSWHDWKWYENNINKSGTDVVKDLVNFYESFEYIGDDFFTEGNLKKLVTEVTNISDLYNKVLHKACPSSIISKVMECNLGATDCRDLIATIGIPALLPVIETFVASDSKYVEMLNGVRELNSQFNTEVVKLDRGNRIRIKADEELQALYRSEFSVSMNIAASYLKNPPGTIIASHMSGVNNRAWSIKAGKDGNIIIEVYYREGEATRKLSLLTESNILTSSDSTFIPFGFTYKEGRVKAYSLDTELILKTTQNERAESYQIPEELRQTVGAGTSTVKIVLAGDDTRGGNSTFSGKFDNFKMYNKALDGFPNEDLGISEVDSITEDMVIWLRMGDDLEDSIDKTNRNTKTNRIFNQIREEYHGTPFGFEYKGPQLPGFETGIVIAAREPANAAELVMQEIEKYIDINAFCTVLVRLMLEAFGARFPTFDTPRATLVRPFGNFYFQINQAVAMAIFGILWGLIVSLLEKLIDCNMLNVKNAADFLSGDIAGAMTEISQMANKGISDELEAAVKKIAPMLKDLAQARLDIGMDSAGPGGAISTTDNFSITSDAAGNTKTKAKGTSAFSFLEDTLNKYSDLNVVTPDQVTLAASTQGPLSPPSTTSAQNSISMLQSVTSVSQELTPYENMSLLIGEAEEETIEKAREALPQNLRTLFVDKNDALSSTFSLIGHLAGLSDIKKDIVAKAQESFSAKEPFQSCITQADIRERILEQSLDRGEITEEEADRAREKAQEEKKQALQVAIESIKQMGTNLGGDLKDQMEVIPQPKILQNITQKVFRKMLDPVKISFDKDMKLYKAAIAKKKIHEKKIPKILAKGENITFRSLEETKFIEQRGEVQKTMVNPEFQALLSTGYVPLLEDGITIDGTPEGGYLARDEELEYIDESRIYKKHEFVTINPPGSNNSYPDPGRFRDAESVGPYTDFENPIATRKIETNILMGNLRDHLKAETLTKSFFSGRELDNGSFKSLDTEEDISFNISDMFGFGDSMTTIGDEVEETIVRVLILNGVRATSRYAATSRSMNLATPVTTAGATTTATTEQFVDSQWACSTHELLNSISDLHSKVVAIGVILENNNQSKGMMYSQLAYFTRGLEKLYMENIYTSPEDYNVAIENIVRDSSYYGMRGQTSETVLSDVATTSGFVDPAMKNDFTVRFSDEYSLSYENKTKLFIERFGRTPYSAVAEVENSLSPELAKMLEAIDPEEAADTECEDLIADGVSNLKMTSQERAFNVLMRRFWMKVYHRAGGGTVTNAVEGTAGYSSNRVRDTGTATDVINDVIAERASFTNAIERKMLKPYLDNFTEKQSSVFDRITREIISFLSEELSSSPLITPVNGTENVDTGESLIGAHFINFNPTQSPAHKKAKKDPRLFNFDSIYELATSLFTHLNSQENRKYNVSADKNVDTPMSMTMASMSALMLVRAYCLEYVLQAIVPILYYNKPMDALTKELIKKRMMTEMSETFNMTPKMSKAIIKANNSMVDSKFKYPTSGEEMGSYYDFSDRPIVSDSKDGLFEVLDYLIEREYLEVTKKLKQNINNVCEVPSITGEEQNVVDLALREKFVDSLQVLSVEKNRFKDFNWQDASKGKIILEKYVRGINGEVITKMRRFHMEGDPNPDQVRYDFEWDNEELLLSKDVTAYGVRVAYVEKQEPNMYLNKYGIVEQTPEDQKIDLQILQNIDFDKVEQGDKAHVQVVDSGDYQEMMFVHVLCSYEETREQALQNLGVDTADPCDIEQFFTRDSSKELKTTEKDLNIAFDYVETDGSYSLPDPDFGRVRTKRIVVKSHHHNAVSLPSEEHQSISSEDITSEPTHHRVVDRYYISYNDAVNKEHTHDIVGNTIKPAVVQAEMNVWLSKASSLRGNYKRPSSWPLQEFASGQEPGLLTDRSIRFFNKTEEEVQAMIEEHNEDYPVTFADGDMFTPLDRDSINNYVLVKYKKNITHDHVHTEQIPLDFDLTLSDQLFSNLLRQVAKDDEFRIMFDFSFDLDKYTSLVSSYAYMANTSQEFEQMFSQTKHNIAMLTAIGEELSDYNKSFEECNSSQASKTFEFPAHSWNPDLLLFMLRTPLQVYKGWVKTADPHTLITQTIVELLKAGLIIPKFEEKSFEIPFSDPKRCLPINTPVYPGVRVDFPGMTQLTALGVTYAPLVVGAPPFIPTPFGLIYYAAVDPLLFLLDGISSNQVLENEDLKRELDNIGLNIRQDGSCIICDKGEEASEEPDEVEDSSYSLCKPENETTFSILDMSKFGKARGC